MKETCIGVHDVPMGDGEDLSGIILGKSGFCFRRGRVAVCVAPIGIGEDGFERGKDSGQNSRALEGLFRFFHLLVSFATSPDVLCLCYSFHFGRLASYLEMLPFRFRTAD